MMKQKIVLATSNLGKVKEMQDILTEFGFDVIAQTELNISSPEETGLTFVENALIKARYASQQSGLPAIADDSGLCVEALQGAPGLYSARYAGKNANDAQNRQHLLMTLQHLTNHEQRKAKFISCIVLLQHPNDPTPVIAEGECAGYIDFQEKGCHGFGYDRLFFSQDTQCTFAELDTLEKKKISHRARALIQLKQKLHRQ